LHSAEVIDGQEARGAPSSVTARPYRAFGMFAGPETGRMSNIDLARICRPANGAVAWRRTIAGLPDGFAASMNARRPRSTFSSVESAGGCPGVAQPVRRLLE
jgi:hypothetical protein